MAKHKRSRGVESTTTWNKSSLWSEQGLNSVSAPDFESGAMFLESPENFSYQKPVLKLPSACFEKLIFKHAFYVRKTKGTAKTSTWRRCLLLLLRIRSAHLQILGFPFSYPELRSSWPAPRIESSGRGRYVMYGELLCTQCILYHFIHIMSYIRLCPAIQDYIHLYTAKHIMYIGYIIIPHT